MRANCNKTFGKKKTQGERFGPGSQPADPFFQPHLHHWQVRNPGKRQNTERPKVDHIPPREQASCPGTTKLGPNSGFSLVDLEFIDGARLMQGTSFVILKDKGFRSLRESLVHSASRPGISSPGTANTVWDQFLHSQQSQCVWYLPGSHAQKSTRFWDLSISRIPEPGPPEPRKRLQELVAFLDFRSKSTRKHSGGNHCLEMVWKPLIAKFSKIHGTSGEMTKQLVTVGNFAKFG